MQRGSRSRFRLLATLLGCWLGLGGPAPASSAPSPDATGDDYVQHMQAGHDAQQRDDCRAAIEAYRAAYDSASLHDDRYFAVKEAASCYEQLWETESDPELLRHERDMLEDFVGRQPDAAGGSGDDAIAQRLEQLRLRIEALETRREQPGQVAPAADEQPAAPDEQPPITRPELRPQTQPPEDPTTRAPTRHRDRLGVGLLVGGGATTALGIIPLVIGAATPARAEDDIDASIAAGINAPEQRPAYLQENRERANALMITGAVVMTVGAVVAIVGGARLGRRRASKTARRLDSGSFTLGPAAAPYL